MVNEKCSISKKNFLNKKTIFLSGIIIAIILFCVWQNNDLTVTRYDISSEKLSQDFDGYRIVQISDLHNKRFGSNQKRLLSTIEKEAPDMIVVTGDLLDSNRTDIPIAMEFIEGAVNLAPVYYVTGNHENWLEASVKKELIEKLKQAGVTVLENERVEIVSGDASFGLIGLRNENLGDNTLKQLMADEENEVEAELFELLLAHEPQYLEHYALASVDLVLSGHAHGGQFRIPFVGGVVAPDQGIFPEYTSGSHTSGETTMIISRGLGNSIIPVRIFNRPEIVVVDLKSEATSADTQGGKLQEEIAE